MGKDLIEIVNELSRFDINRMDPKFQKISDLINLGLTGIGGVVCYNKDKNVYNIDLDKFEYESGEDFIHYVEISTPCNVFIIYLNAGRGCPSVLDICIDFKKLSELIDGLDASLYKNELIKAYHDICCDDGMKASLDYFTYGFYHMFRIDNSYPDFIDMDCQDTMWYQLIPQAIPEEIKDPRQDVRTKAWIGAVKLRDEFKCRRCGSNERLNAHHIIPICSEPDLAFDINNGISLCEKCHIEFHSKYGNSNIGHFECYEFIKSSEL